MGQLLLLMLAVAAFSAIFLNGTIALKCYLQPGIAEEDENLGRFSLGQAKQKVLDVKDKMIETECPAEYQACIVGKKCHLNYMDIVEMKNQDFRHCAPKDMDMCKTKIPNNYGPVAFTPFIGGNGDTACAEGCRVCYTDLCNGKVENGEKTTTAKNEEKNNNNKNNGENNNNNGDNNNKEGGENNGSSSHGSPPIALLLIGTITVVVVGTRHKM